MANNNCGCDCDSIELPIGPIGIQGIQGIPGVSTNGTNGTDGTNGVSVLVNDFVETNVSSIGAFSTLKTYTVPINTLQTNGDKLTIRSKVVGDLTSWGYTKGQTRYLIDGVDVQGVFDYDTFYGDNVRHIETLYEITRTSSTIINVCRSVKFSGLKNGLTDTRSILSESIQDTITMTIPNLITNTLSIVFQAALSISSSTITTKHFEVILYKK